MHTRAYICTLLETRARLVLHGQTNCDTLLLRVLEQLRNFEIQAAHSYFKIKHRLNVMLKYSIKL